MVSKSHTTYDFTDAVVVERRAADRLVENGGVRGEARDGVLVDVALQSPIVEDAARDVVEPKALPEVVQFLGQAHVDTSKSDG